jgi:CAAX prenyl protease-like protein
LTGPFQFFPAWSSYLYIAKTVFVGTLLWFWRYEYAADVSHRLSFSEWLSAIFCGLLTLAIWIVPAGHLFQFDKNSGFDPYALGRSAAAAGAFISVRFIGATVVVPVMEELFWRSFLMRYLITRIFGPCRWALFPGFPFWVW